MGAGALRGAITVPAEGIAPNAVVGVGAAYEGINGVAVDVPYQDPAFAQIAAGLSVDRFAWHLMSPLTNVQKQYYRYIPRVDNGSRRVISVSRVETEFMADDRCDYPVPAAYTNQARYLVTFRGGERRCAPQSEGFADSRPKSHSRLFFGVR